MCVCAWGEETGGDTVVPSQQLYRRRGWWWRRRNESLLHLRLLLLNTCLCTISLPHVALSILNNLCEGKIEGKKKTMPFFFSFAHLRFYETFFFFMFLGRCFCFQCTVAVNHSRVSDRNERKRLIGTVHARQSRKQDLWLREDDGKIRSCGRRMRSSLFSLLSLQLKLRLSPDLPRTSG